MSVNLPGSDANPGATRWQIGSARRIPKATMMHAAVRISASVEAANRLAASGPSFSRMPMYVGRTAADAMFSARRSLKKFGMRNAATNACVAGEAPKRYAKLCSLRSPVIREIPTPALIARAFPPILVVIVN